MGIYREILRIEGDTRSAQEAVGDLNQSQEGLRQGLQVLQHSGLLAFGSIAGAVATVREYIQGMMQDTRDAIRAMDELEQASLPLIGMSDKPGFSGRAEERALIQELRFRYAEEDPGRIAALVSEARSRLNLLAPEAVDPAVRFALAAQVGVGAPAQPLLAAMASIGTAFPERLKDITGLGELLWRGYQAAPIGSLEQYAQTVPRIAGVAAVSGVSLEEAMILQALMTMGEMDPMQAATEARGAIGGFLGQTPEQQAFLQQQGLAGLPVRQRLERLQQLTGGMTPEQRTLFYREFLPEREAQRAVNRALANLGAWGVTEAQIRGGADVSEGLRDLIRAGGGPTIMEREAERMAELGFRGKQVDVGVDIMLGKEAAEYQPAGYEEFEQLYRAAGYSKLSRGMLAAMYALQNWFLEYRPHRAFPTLLGLEPEPASRGEVLGWTRELLQERGVGATNVHNGPVINYGVKGPGERAQPTSRPAAVIGS